MKIEQWMIEAAKEVRTNIQPDLLRVSKFNIVAFAKIIAKHAHLRTVHGAAANLQGCADLTSGLLNHQNRVKGR